jgi:hypothetical protein
MRVPVCVRARSACAVYVACVAAALWVGISARHPGASMPAAADIQHEWKTQLQGSMGVTGHGVAGRLWYYMSVMRVESVGCGPI